MTPNSAAPAEGWEWLCDPVQLQACKAMTAFCESRAREHLPPPEPHTLETYDPDEDGYIWDWNPERAARTQVSQVLKQLLGAAPGIRG